MEQNGYRLDSIRYSYFFHFKKTNPKKMNYFLSCKTFRGQSTGTYDYALESNHNAHVIESKMSYYTMYRTKEQKENLSLLYEARLGYIKTKLLEKSSTSIFLTILFIAILLAEIFTTPSISGVCIIGVFVVISACITAYYLFGYFKQKSKCKKYRNLSSTNL